MCKEKLKLKSKAVSVMAMHAHHTVSELIEFKRGLFCLFLFLYLFHVSACLVANRSLPPFADVMWRIKHARRTRAGAMAYADVCLCMTHSFPSSTLVRATAYVYDLCVLIACVTFNILPTLKLKLTSHNCL